MATTHVQQKPVRSSLTGMLMLVLLVLSVVPTTLGHPSPFPANPKPASNKKNMAATASACTAVLKQTKSAESTSKSLHKRTQSYNDLVQQGNRNRCEQEALEAEVEQSQFQPDDYNQLVQFGWIDSRGTSRAMSDSVLGRVESRYFSRNWPQGIGMALETPPLVANRWIHEKESTKTYRPCGTGAPKKYNPTFASYTTVMDIQGGVIVAEFDKIYDPQRSIRENRPRWKGGDVAPLSEWNDVIFLEWSKQKSASLQRLGVGRPVDIKYIVFSEVLSSEDNGGKEAINTMIEAMTRTNSGNVGLPVFKHKRTFSYATQSDVEAFHALLGTRPGDMVTDLLARHKEALGLRRVTDISVFGTGPFQERYNRERVRAGMVFKIEAAGSLAGSSSGTSATTPELSSASASDQEGNSGAQTPGEGVPHPGDAVYQIPQDGTK
ncbi:hypothetical protein Q7P37_002809 [Cladosporium fusiforme]